MTNQMEMKVREKKTSPQLLHRSVEHTDQLSVFGSAGVDSKEVFLFFVGTAYHFHTDSIPEINPSASHLETSSYCPSVCAYPK